MCVCNIINYIFIDRHRGMVMLRNIDACKCCQKVLVYSERPQTTVTMFFLCFFKYILDIVIQDKLPQ